jgi:predicted NBD/HSP70 family sugar kinase
VTTSAKAKLMRRLNHSAVLDVVREHSPISPTGISDCLKLTLPTVIRILKELEVEGLIRETGLTQASGGRPRVLVEFNPSNSAVIGIDLSGAKMYGAISDLGGTIQEEIGYQYGQESGPQLIDRLEEMIEYLLQFPRSAGQTIRGIGIGAPGLTDADQGIVTLAVSLGWRNVPLRDILQKRFNVPVMVENDVNLEALGEYGFGVGKGASSLVCISIGTGIGAGVVIDRKIYHGFHKSAGEIGYLLPGVEYLRQIYPGFGALESVASGTSAAARLRALSAGQGQPDEDITADTVFTAARMRQPWAVQVLNDTINYLSIAVSSVSTILDPEVIVLGGSMAVSSGINFIDPIKERLQGVIPILPTIVQTQLGYRASVMGAIMSVLDATTDHLAINRLA